MNLSILKATDLAAFWFNPRSGTSTKSANFTNDEKPEFEPWSVGRGSDFVLVIMDKNTPYKLPE